MSAKKARPPLDMNNLPHGLAPDEAAQVIGVSMDTWYRHVQPHVRRGDILTIKIGRSVRIITRSLLAWQEQQARQA